MPVTEHSEEFFQKGGRHTIHVGHYHIVLYWEPYYDAMSQGIEKAFTVDILTGMNVTTRKRFDDLFEAMTFVVVQERELAIQAMADALLNPP